jgi:hypothetical protein
MRPLQRPASRALPLAGPDRDIAVATRFIRETNSTGGHRRRAARTEDTLMYTIVRSYFGKGSKELFDVVEKNKGDVEKLMRSVKGFVSYAVVRSGDGGFTVTVCNDKAGADESVEKARDWIAKNAAGTGVDPPTISEGPNILDLKNGP